MRTILMLTTAVGVISLSVAMAPVTVRAFETCDPFVVSYDHDTAQRAFMDHGEEGQDVGDRRIIHAQLLSDSGEVIGHFDAEQIILHSHDDGETRAASDVTLHLPTGVLLYRITSAPTIAHMGDTHLPILSADAARVIVGGSGVFDGATGTVGITYEDDDSTTARINVSCR